MPLIFDSLNLMFLGAVAVFAGGIVKANPDLTKPHPDSAYGKWQAKKREKVSHEQSSRGCLRIAPLERELTMSPDARRGTVSYTHLTLPTTPYV